jgi:hypothetical protein
MGYVDLGWLICDRWDPRDLISHGFGFRRRALRKGDYSKSARVIIRVLAMRVEGLRGGYQ